MKRSIRALSLIILAALTIGICGSILSEANAKPVSYQLPAPTATFKPGPNLELAQKNCMACHSVDYVQTQPRGPKFKDAFWQAEVTKMIKVYGAAIDEADVGKIVDYLTQTY